MNFTPSRREFLRAAVLGLPALGWLAASARGARVSSGERPVDLGFMESQIKVVRRKDWSTEALDLRHLRAAARFSRITVHHAGNEPDFSTSRRSIEQKLNGMLAAHRQRRYGDIGYHFIVDYAGGVWEGRPLRYEGAHVLSENEQNIGIVLLGNFERQMPSRKQVAATARVVNLFRQRYGIARHRLYGHCDLGSSACPGRNMYRYVARLRS